MRRSRNGATTWKRSRDRQHLHGRILPVLDRIFPETTLRASVYGRLVPASAWLGLSLTSACSMPARKNGNLRPPEMCAESPEDGRL
jgi:hypothetical protein